MTENAEAILKEAIQLAKAGKNAEARPLLDRVTELDPYNEKAWLWLSGVVDTDDDRRICLENVLTINPANERAKKGLEAINASAPPPPAPLAPPPPAAPAAPTWSAYNPATSPQEPAPAQPTPPSTSSAYDPPTATSSASSTFVPEEPAAEIYDDWIGSLNLGGKTKKASNTEAVGPFTVPEAFDDDAFADVSLSGFSFGIDDEEDADDQPAYIPPPRNSVASAFIDEVGDVDFGSDPFGDDDEDPDPFNDPFMDGNDRADDAFGGSGSLNSGLFSVAALDDEAVDNKPVRGGRAGAAAGRGDAARGAGSNAARQAGGGKGASASRNFIGDDVKPADELDPGEYFKRIPENIRATRLPGTDAPRPVLLRLLVMILVVLNLLAAAWLALQLAG